MFILRATRKRSSAARFLRRIGEALPAAADEP